MVKLIVVSWIGTVPIAPLLGVIVWFGVDWIFGSLGLGI
jgi:hypothetical protein